ncbi:CD82 antigen [Camponotus floridanus]|uniref:Tetraspanin n=2 Tax=Camponotus floridanus TaxID=104421 RepID=E2A9R3_CAMFO|nr:CD82 antigen isoform X1 [Camponotus floridanus]EFN69865.1 CD82 antigen [Camponotus floridanus]
MGTFCYNFSKYALMVVSFVFLIIAITVIALAAWMLTDKTFLVSIAQESNNYDAGLYILLAAGILMFIVAFLGCYGAFKHSRCSLITFFVIMLVIIVAQIASAGWLYTNCDRLDELLRSSVSNTVKKEYGEVECRTQIMDTIQSGLECCGANGPADWAGSKYGSLSKDPSLPISLTVSADADNMYKVPESCCKEIHSSACNESRNLKIAGIVSPAIYNEGCTQKLVDTLKGQTSNVMIIALLVLIVEILGLILALICCCEGGASDRYKA